MEFLEILYQSIILIISFDYEVYEIILLSLRISGLATFLSLIFGVMTAYFLVINKSKINNYLIIFLNSLMGIPPVVVGLIVYFIFSKGGLLGVFSILYTPISMIMGFLFSYISRKNEFAADAYSAKTANLPDSLISGLKKMSKENLSNLTPHWLNVI